MDGTTDKRTYSVHSKACSLREWGGADQMFSYYSHMTRQNNSLEEEEEKVIINEGKG